MLFTGSQMFENDPKQGYLAQGWGNQGLGSETSWKTWNHCASTFWYLWQHFCFQYFEKPILYDKTKDVEIDCRFIKEKQESSVNEMVDKCKYLDERRLQYIG